MSICMQVGCSQTELWPHFPKHLCRVSALKTAFFSLFLLLYPCILFLKKIEEEVGCVLYLSNCEGYVGFVLSYQIGFVIVNYCVENS